MEEGTVVRRGTLRRQLVLLAGVIVVAGGLAAWWISTVGRAADKRFDITDEGYYLLSYPWWDQNPLALTGVQYLNRRRWITGVDRARVVPRAGRRPQGYRGEQVVHATHPTRLEQKTRGTPRRH